VGQARSSMDRGPRSGKHLRPKSRRAHNGTAHLDREDARDVWRQRPSQPPASGGCGTGATQFTRELDLPRDGHRELVRERERVYEVGDESRMLATVASVRTIAS
jgi:hypothetical protein